MTSVNLFARGQTRVERILSSTTEESLEIHLEDNKLCDKLYLCIILKSEDGAYEQSQAYVLLLAPSAFSQSLTGHSTETPGAMLTWLSSGS